MKRIAWSIEWNNKDPEYWTRKDDSHQDAMVHLAKTYDVVVAVLHPDRTDTAEIRGVRYLFCKDSHTLVERLVLEQPDLVNYWGFDRPSSRQLDELLPDIPKTVYPVGAQTKASPTADLPFVDRVFVTTPEQRQKIYDETHYPRRQVVVCPFVATNTFRAKTDAEYGAESIDVIYVSDWRPLKRQSILIDALPAIAADRVVFVGDIQDAAYFAAERPKVAAAGDTAVEVILRVPPRIVAEKYRSAKIAVQLSNSEGGSRVVIEAMACGLPLIVCRDCETNAQQVDHGKNGFVIDPTPEALAATINALLAQPDQRETIGRAAADHIWQRPAEDTMAGIFAREFRKILGE
jgi:glycosyltransferase involved in cell wall biosynthesis